MCACGEGGGEGECVLVVPRAICPLSSFLYIQNKDTYKLLVQRIRTHAY